MQRRVAASRVALLIIAALAAGIEGWHRPNWSAERLGQPHYRWVTQSLRAVLAILAGRLDEAEALLPQIAETGHRLGEPDAMNVVGI